MKMLSAFIEEHIDEAAQAIREGYLVAFPTETVYGLGGDGLNPEALAKIFEAKGRPRFDPLIIHIASLDALPLLADLGALAEREKANLLIERLWPGPLTLILPKQSRVPDLATSGLPTVAIRFPSHPAARKLITKSTGAVAAPSANLFGRLSPTAAEHVRDQLGDRVDIILDGGSAELGVESTVLDISDGKPRILRPGGTTGEEIEAIIGPVDWFEAAGRKQPEGDAQKSPGNLASHYAPRTPLTLQSGEELIALPYQPREGWLFFDRKSFQAWARNAGLAGSPGEIGGIRILSETGDLREAASRLFQTLHEMDREGYLRIHAQRAPDSGLGPAINDRLGRASVR